MAKLKNCKHCHHEVAKSAEKCPNCGGSLKSSFSSKIWGSFFFLCLLGYLLSMGDKTKTKSLTPTASTETQQHTKNTTKPIKKPKKLPSCNDIRTAMLMTIKAGASVRVVSKGAHDLYSAVSTSGPASHCKNLRWSFRTLKKPYEGESVSPQDWDEAIKLLLN